MGVLLAPASSGYSPAVSQSQIINSFKQQDFVKNLVGEPQLDQSSPIAQMHNVTAEWGNLTGVSAGTTFPAWVVQVEVPFDQSFANSNLPYGVTPAAASSAAASEVVCDAAIFDLATQQWTGAWEGSCQGVPISSGAVAHP
jgi:hypothetical protein